jgi:hypothetical protein
VETTDLSLLDDAIDDDFVLFHLVFEDGVLLQEPGREIIRLFGPVIDADAEAANVFVLNEFFFA